MFKHTRSGVTLLLICATTLMFGCEDGGGSGGSIVTTTNTNSESVDSGGDCSNVLDSNITSPTTLVNTSAYCDYELSGWVDVRSTLTIEPGVVIRAKADSRLVVEGGQIEAVGTEQNRIVFEGASSVQGYWLGIAIRGGRPSVFDYVDVKDGGQVCHIIFCEDGAFQVDNSVFSFTNSTVSNSYAHGMIILEDVRIAAFENNRFHGNAWNGLAIDGELVPDLDVNSDYAGVGNENGLPYVGIRVGSQERGEVFHWKKLSAPYFIGTYYNVEGGILHLETGVEMVFGKGAWLRITENGVLQSMGTAQTPNVFRGHIEEPGYWDSVQFSWSPWSNNIISYTTFSHSGYIDNINSSYAALYLNESKVTLTGNIFAYNQWWGISCSDPEYSDVSIIIDKGDNRFLQNNHGNVNSHCSIR